MDDAGAQTVESLQRRLAEERRARQAAERLVAERSAALDAAFDGVALTDPDGMFVYMNDSHARMFGWEPAAALGRSWRALYAPAEIRFFEEEVFPTIGETGAWRGEVAGRRADGTPVHQEVTLTLLETGLLCVTRDSGERRALEQDRRRLADRLRGAESMAMLGRFAAALSHDFSAVIGAARHYAQSCRAADSAAARRRDFDGLETSLDRAQGLIQRLLQIGRGEAPSPLERVDLPVVLSETFDLVFSGSDTPAQLLGEKRAADVAGDKLRLEQLFANLLFNAEQACRGEVGAEVSAELHAVASPQEWAALDGALWGFDIEGVRREHVFGGLDGAGWAVSVRDSGRGMDEAALARLFQPFFSTRTTEGGHGLGLVSIETSLEALGGRICYRSAPGVGTLAIAFIPAALSAPRPGAVAAASAPRVMVIEDDPRAGAAIQGALRSLGCAPSLYHDPESALRDFTLDPGWAAVVSDCGLGEIDGAELASALGGWRPTTPVFVVSSSPKALQAARRSAPNAAGCFAKPLSDQALEAIRLACGLR